MLGRNDKKRLGNEMTNGGLVALTTIRYPYYTFQNYCYICRQEPETVKGPKAVQKPKATKEPETFKAPER